MQDAQMPQPTKLLKKLTTIFSKIDSLPKDGTNDFHRYKFASESAAKRALHPLFAEQGVILKTDVLNVEQVILQSKDKNGATKELTKITLAYTFIDCESGESLPGQFMGYGEDSNDKGVWKAVTGCVKYILFNTFLIPTGDDPDNDDTKPPKTAAKTTTPAASTAPRPPAKGPTYYPPKSTAPASTAPATAPTPSTAPPMPKSMATPPKDEPVTSTGHVKGTMTPAQNAKIYAMLGELKVEKEKADAWVAKVIPGKDRLSALNVDEAIRVIDQLEIKLQAKPKEPPAPAAAAPIDWMHEARNCADQDSATILMETAKQAGLSNLRLGALKGALAAKGFTV